MQYQLPSGRVVEMSVERFLDMTDEEIQYLDYSGTGDHIENPFFGSSISKGASFEFDDDDLDDSFKELTDIDIYDKLADQDADFYDEE